VKYLYNAKNLKRIKGALGSGSLGWLKEVSFQVTPESSNWLDFANVDGEWIPDMWCRDTETTRCQWQVMLWYYQLMRTRWVQAYNTVRRYSIECLECQGGKLEQYTSVEIHVNHRYKGKTITWPIQHEMNAGSNDWATLNASCDNCQYTLQLHHHFV